MEAMQPTLRNGRNVWDQINMPAHEFHERVRKVREKMQEKHMDVLLAYGNAFNDYANPCYFSNYVIRLPRGALVAIHKEGEVVLFFEGASRGLSSAKKTSCVEDVRPCPDVSRGYTQYLKEKGLIPSTVGCVGLKQLMPHYQRKFLTDALEGCTLINADPMVREMRMIKSIRECDQIRRSSRIVKDIINFLPDISFPDMNERAVEASIIREARFEGAEDVRVLFGRPQEPKWALRPPEEAFIERGIAVIVYLAVAYERYWSEGIRTFNTMENSFSFPDLKKAETLYGELTKRIKPGKAISQCYKEAVGEIQESGRDYIAEYGLGEGIGLSLNEWPILDKKATGNLEEGMCLTLRMCISDKNIGAVMTGNTFFTSKTGVEGLTV